MPNLLIFPESHLPADQSCRSGLRQLRFPGSHLTYQLSPSGQEPTFPMKMQSIEDLLYVGMTYVHNFEQQISAKAGEMAKASSNPELKSTFEKSESKGKEYAQRIERAFEKLGKPVQSNENHIAKAMIHEVENMIAHTDASPVRDAALIVAANQQQLYRVAAYGSLKDYAGLIGKQGAVAELEQNLDDSKGGDAKLTRIGQEQVNPEAAHANA